MLQKLSKKCMIETHRMLKGNLMKDTLLDNLNEKQLEAVTTTEGYVRVIAGAGSGKTKALTHRYAYLVREAGISPANILCITFTNKAANEMKKRIKYLLGEEFDTSFVATLHSYCTRILREDIGKLFYPESFIVLDTADQKRILEEVYEEFNISMDTATFQFMIDKIRYYKNLITYMDFIAVPKEDIGKYEAKTLEEAIILRYIQKQKKYFGLDFFDLINFVIYLFRKHGDVLDKWQKRMHYVLVDEFQDITVKEFKLIRQLTEINKNWFVVGDPDQNIYEWRGSNMQVLLEFDQKMEPCKTIFLNENYRSTPQILNAANSLIEKNKNRIKKDLYTKKEDGALPEHFHSKDENEEINFIVKTIQAHTEKGGNYKDIAVLYRSNFVSRFIEQGFLKANIPYLVYGGVGVYDRMEIKDVLSYLRMIAFGDDLSFLRIVNMPKRKIGKTKLVFLKQKSEAENISYYEAMKRYIHEPVFKGCGGADFIQVIERLKLDAEELPVSELLQKLLIDSGYEPYIRESGDMDRLDNISELLRSIVISETEYGEFLPLITFLQDVSLNRDLDIEDKQDCVKIMTIHTAKGLEFDTVVLAGANERTLPSIRALEERQEDALEEERRLCFVAVTRAKKKLYITESEGFGIKGYTKVPSRFVFDIGDESILRTGSISDELKEEYRFQVGAVRVPGVANYAVGSQVKHKVFGEGMVEEIDEETKTYMIRFMIGIKPISFHYSGLSQVF